MAKEAKAKKVYLDGEGNESRSAKPGVEVLRFEFANGNSYAVQLGDFPEAVLRSATWHGLAQKMGDEYSGAKSPDEAEEAFLNVRERLMAGDWVTERQAAGPRISLVLEAVMTAYQEAGKPLDAAAIEERREGLKDAAVRKAALEHPAINAVYLRLQAERAAKKAAFAAAKAAESASL